MSKSVVFVDDGDDIAPTYSLIVNDGIKSSLPVAASVEFTSPELSAATEVKTIDNDIDIFQSTAQLIPVQTLAVSSNASVPLTVVSSSTEDSNIEEIAEDQNLESGSIQFEEDQSTSTDVALTVDQAERIVKIKALDSISEGDLISLLQKNATILNILTTPFELDQLNSEIRTVFESQGFNEQLNSMREDINNSTSTQEVVVGTSVAISTGLSVSYVIWLVRGGVLISTVLSSLPAWQFIDPLPILSNTGNQGAGGNSGESLQDIIDNHDGNSSHETSRVEQATKGSTAL